MADPDNDFARWLVSSIRSGLVAIDAAGRVAAWNEEARRILGCPAGPPQSALGRDCRDVLTAQPTVSRLLFDTLDGRERPTRTELVLSPSHGHAARTIGFTLLPVRDASGHVRGAAMLFRDLTPYERMNEQERLRDRLAALGQMAAGLAHELRNPLAGIEVLSGLLKRRLADRPAERELVDDLSVEVRRLAETVSASLEFVRPVALRSEPVDPAKLMEEALTRARARADYRGTIEREYAETLPMLHIDAEGLRAVLTNLILNAFEAMSGSGPDAAQRLRLGLQIETDQHPACSVRVGADGLPALDSDAEGPELVLSVGDSGPGVPEELHERIFYPFFTTKQRGCGIGLANAQKIVAGHRGRLELESRPGAGATFRVRLPLAAGART